MSTITAQAPLPKSIIKTTQPKLESKQEDTVEAPALEAVKDDALSPQYAAIARREKDLRRQAKAIQAEKEALKAKMTEYETSYVPKNKLAEMIEKDPASLGLSYEQLTNLLLNQPKPEELAVRDLRSEIQKVKDEQAQTKTLFEESQKKAYDQAVNQIRNDTKLLVDSDLNFETIKETNSIEAVVELIKETFDKDGILLTVEDAAKEVENYLIEEALKMANLNKVKQKLMPQPTEEKAIEKPVMKTLTNAITATSTKPGEKGRRERAIAAFKGQLS